MNIYNDNMLYDISDVKVNTHLPRDERIRDFVRQIGNPYFFKCGKFKVKARYAENGESFEDCVSGFFL